MARLFLTGHYYLEWPLPEANDMGVIFNKQIVYGRTFYQKI